MSENMHSSNPRGAGTSGDAINLTELLGVMIRRRRQIVGIWGLVVAAVVIYCYVATPIYRAESVIIIDKEDAGRGALMDAAMAMPLMAMMGGSINSDYYQTQCDILESRSVAYNVIQRLNLEKNDDFLPKKSFIAGLLSRGEPDAATLKNDMIKAFRQSLKVEKAMGSQCAKISYLSKNPELAATIANAVVDAYRDHAFAMKVDTVRDSAAWLKENLEEERKKLAAAEQALVAYQEENDIVVDVSKDAESSNMAMKKLTELSVLAVKAGSERAEAETRYRQAATVADRPDRLDSVPEIQESDLITSIKTMEAELLQRRSELSKRYGPLHPQMKAVEAELKTMRAKKEQEIKRIISALENAYLAKLAKEQAIQDDLNRYKTNFFKLGKNATEFTRLYVEAMGARVMYTALLRKLKETEVTEDLKVGNIRVVDEAEPPSKPVKPRKLMYPCLGIMIGFFLAIGTALALEFLQPQLQSLRQLYRNER